MHHLDIPLFRYHTYSVKHIISVCQPIFSSTSLWMSTKQVSHACRISPVQFLKVKDSRDTCRTRILQLESIQETIPVHRDKMVMPHTRSVSSCVCFRSGTVLDMILKVPCDSKHLDGLSQAVFPPVSRHFASKRTYIIEWSSLTVCSTTKPIFHTLHPPQPHHNDTNTSDGEEDNQEGRCPQAHCYGYQQASQRDEGESKTNYTQG
jgi:hypothetical protein